jgi:trafficking protein particle complex subunit 6
MSFDSPLPPFNASDPAATFLNSSCLDFLLIELVPMAYRLANEIDNGEKEGDIIESEKESGSISASGGRATGTGTTTRVGGGKMDEDEERDAAFYRLEMLGYRVGQGLVERYAIFKLYMFFFSFQGKADLTMQLLPRPATLHRYARRNQVPLQGFVDASL